MEFYDVVNSRRTIRDFQKKQVPQDILDRILSAGLKGPSGDHMRDIHYVVIRDNEKIKKVLHLVGESGGKQFQALKERAFDTESQKEMYLDAVPKQTQMLLDSGTLILPFFKHKGDFLKPEKLGNFNNFASAWCGIENILLAATAENLACAFRIPNSEEANHVTKTLQVPAGYVLCCYLSVGYPKEDAVVNKQVHATLEDKVHYNSW